ncbi:MAG: hypothetical protein HC800_13700 [Phormidesmis sp. RL_2_1]|nr:hypothetical protein [Phormidesmis sp. RL_2_1]
MAKQLKMPGGKIQAIAQDAITIAQANNAKAITFSHIHQALTQQDKTLGSMLKL